MERPVHPFEYRAGFLEAVGERAVRERDDLVPFDVDVPVQVADQVCDSCRFGDIARPDHENVFVGRRDDVSGLGVVMEELPGMEDGAGGKFQRQDDAVRRLHHAPHPSSIMGAHTELNHGEVGGRFDVVRQ
jgi:hypothetical protein